MRAVRFVWSLVGRLQPDRIRPEGPPVVITDPEGRELVVRSYWESDFEPLATMYDTFDPAQRAQGTPPAASDGVRRWLRDVLHGVNVLAVHDDRVAGHVSFVPDGTGRHELAVFVHHEYQGVGIGTRLLGVGLGQARQAGVEYVWLSVRADQRRPQRLYCHAGFRTIDATGTAHRMSRYL